MKKVQAEYQIYWLPGIAPMGPVDKPNTRWQQNLLV